MSFSLTSTHVPVTSSGSKFIEMFSNPNISTPSRAAPTRASAPVKWSPLTKSEARTLMQSQLLPGATPPLDRPPMPRSEINRLARKIGRENILQRTIHPIPETVLQSTSGTRTRPASKAKWSPLTKSEANALIQWKLFPASNPPPPGRPPMPRSEINRLAHKMGRENTLQRTLHLIPAPIAPVLQTPDQRILYTHRRKSYTKPSDQFERDPTPLW
ncbi:hypothetical protein B0H12DRAFT_1253022 [Mycena haematopus]|nr:hypothetical protein B0H12DRAFT_1253022 [Mycena haematopus]